MNSKVVLLITLTIFLISILVSVSNIPSVKAGTITVPDDYATIQEAINHASGGDAIYVRSGTYYENVVVNKTVLLIGESRENTIIDARGTGKTLELTVDGVLVSNFTISYGEVGIHMTSSHKHTIRNNMIRKNTRGATGNFYTGTIYENNIVKENDYGLDFGHLSGPSSINNTAENNEIYDNVVAGIYVSAADGNNTIIGNDIHDNGIGIVLDHTQNNKITINLIRNNNRAGGYMYGIYLRNAIQNIIKENLFQGNIVGMHFENSNNNKIFHNNFISNAEHIDGASLNIWDDGYPSGGNHWNDYSGVDLKSGAYQNETGSDGIGDTSYNIDVDNVDKYPLIQQYPVSEFLPSLILPLLMTATLLAVIAYRRKHSM